jgi:hypothetical protein
VLQGLSSCHVLRILRTLDSESRYTAWLTPGGWRFLIMPEVYRDMILLQTLPTVSEAPNWGETEGEDSREWNWKLELRVM